MNVILGNGISAYVIAACLDYLNVDFVILSQNKNLKIPTIIHLQYNNENELLFFKKLFQLDDIENYIKHVKVGYKYLNKIYDTLTKEMLNNYLTKQNRDNQKSSMNDKINNYYALDLSKICSVLVERYKNKVVDNINYDFDKCYIYDTIGKNVIKKSYSFYLVLENNDINDYDYVYDCDNNNIKRYTNTTTEYITPPKNKSYIELLNYYDEFKVIKSKNCCVIGRYATGTQTKQKDIIKYILGDIYGI